MIDRCAERRSSHRRGIGAIAVQRHLDAVAWREPRAGRHRRHQWKLLLGDADRRAISRDAADVTNGRPAREMEKADQRESEDDRAQRPATDSAEYGNHSVLREGYAGV